MFAAPGNGKTRDSRFRGNDEVKDRGTGLSRFPSRDLYARYGLYKVPAVAGWRSAHASA